VACNCSLLPKVREKMVALKIAQVIAVHTKMKIRARICRGKDFRL